MHIPVKNLKAALEELPLQNAEQPKENVKEQSKDVPSGLVRVVGGGLRVVARQAHNIKCPEPATVVAVRHTEGGDGGAEPPLCGSE